MLAADRARTHKAPLRRRRPAHPRSENPSRAHNGCLAAPSTLPSMTSNERNKMTLTLAQRRAAVRRPRIRSRPDRAPSLHARSKQRLPGRVPGAARAAVHNQAAGRAGTLAPARGPDSRATAPAVGGNRDNAGVLAADRAAGRRRAALALMGAAFAAIALGPLTPAFAGGARAARRAPAPKGVPSPAKGQSNKPLDVSVDPRAGIGPVVPGDFLGLSFETGDLHTIAGYAASGDLVNLLRSLGPGIMRFGGISADESTAWLQEGLAPPVGAGDRRAAGPRGARRARAGDGLARAVDGEPGPRRSRRRRAGGARRAGRARREPGRDRHRERARPLRGRLAAAARAGRSRPT